MCSCVFVFNKKLAIICSFAPTKPGPARRCSETSETMGVAASLPHHVKLAAAQALDSFSTPPTSTATQFTHCRHVQRESRPRPEGARLYPARGEPAAHDGPAPQAGRVAGPRHARRLLAHGAGPAGLYPAAGAGAAARLSRQRRVREPAPLGRQPGGRVRGQGRRGAGGVVAADDPQRVRHDGPAARRVQRSGQGVYWYVHFAAAC